MDKKVGEYKRKCKGCKKVWHVLCSKEKKVKNQIQDDWLSTCTCCNLAHLKAKSNLRERKNELEKLRTCSKCLGSFMKK